MKLFCFGLGYTARHLTAKLSPETWHISGTSRSSENLSFDGTAPLENAPEHLQQVTHLLISIPPNQDQIDSVLYHHKSHILNMPNLKWIGYLSATSVYGDHDGDWVDENTSPEPTNKRGALRLKAEQQWQSLDVPIHIFRLGGIYGPDRNQISAVKAGSAEKLVKNNHTFSRIHVEDICTALLASMKKPSSHKIYNIVDDHPASAADVLDFICQQMNIPPLEEILFEGATISPALRSFYDDNKRVSNRITKKALYWLPQFPSYREGYRDILRKLD